ncbi:uncharacterized protein LOC134281832 [Saccostrea cucullata]|uniref:uncharacterized protein LOC134281832 n=1 Tax=Saccostrea cuccullata TaxID=36930 RepID=UPI002ED03C3D
MENEPQGNLRSLSDQSLRIPQHTVMLMECDDLPQGFSRLKLMSPSCYPTIISSRVLISGEVYISSTLFRNNYFQVSRSRSAQMASSFNHGPCSSTKIQNEEADFAFCLWSNHWPTIALPWIQRCRQQGWPSEIVLSKILNAGFHVVPIGSTPENGNEWRISFSIAEQILVYAMNHCQFLCYGLLKFFLKDVINQQNNSSVLCSYFMKTVVFWLLQGGHFLTWSPDNLLSCFWECFKLLIHWVRIGECPNFFIPQNNMFRVKVTGFVQTSLFCQLYDLYCKGISCLLLSETLRPYLSFPILYRSMSSVFTDESSIISSTELDISLFKELYIDNDVGRFREFRAYTEHLKTILVRNMTPYHVVTLQHLTTCVLRNMDFLIQSSIHPKKYRNKIQYKSKKVSNRLIKVSSTFGYVSDILYFAMYWYRDCRYEHSLIILQKAQERMSRPYIIYGYNVNIDMYRQCMTGIPLGRRMRSAVMKDIVLNKNTYINELVMEQFNNKYGRPVLLIPPLVMLHMLFILNHHRLGDTVRSQQSLQDLQTLLLYDDRVNVPTLLRDISWQILGICQQICGDYVGSLQSYQCSLQQKPTHFIQEVTLFRMNSLLNYTAA